MPVAALALVVAASSLDAQTTGQDMRCARHDYDDTTPPCVIGHVIDAATKRPIVLADISEGDTGIGFVRTDSTGAFAMFSHAGVISLAASRNDYDIVRRQINLHDYKTTVVNFTLHRLRAPCCQLAGQWHVELTLLKQQPGVKPTARVISGRMLFGPNIASRDVVGTVLPGDTVELTLIPNISHGSIVVRGRIAGDSITGRWYEQAYGPAAFGHLSMHRFSRTTPELHEPPPPPPPPPQDRSTWGKARVRVWEASRGRYIVATHALEFPDQSEVSAYHTHATVEGWGDTIELPPGGYAILLVDFPNGDQKWRVPAKSARHFTVSTGQTTDVTIRLNLATGTVLDSASRPQHISR